jgi:hypothetical protein
MTRLALCVFAVGSLAVAVRAQAVQADGKIVVDTRKTCQLSVPLDWTTDSGAGSAPGKKATATVHGLRAGQTFEDGKNAATAAMKPIAILQNDAKRLMYTTDPRNLGTAADTGWYVISNTSPVVCTASLTFSAGVDEATIRKVANSLAVVQ